MYEWTDTNKAMTQAIEILAHKVIQHSEETAKQEAVEILKNLKSNSEDRAWLTDKLTQIIIDCNSPNLIKELE